MQIQGQSALVTGGGSGLGEATARELARLGGIEHAVYAEVAGHGRARLYADEDMDRSEADKTAAVHFLRFEFAPEAIMALRAGAELSFGIDDARLPARLAVAGATRDALLKDFG